MEYVVDVSIFDGRYLPPVLLILSSFDCLDIEKYLHCSLSTSKFLDFLIDPNSWRLHPYEHIHLFYSHVFPTHDRDISWHIMTLTPTADLPWGAGSAWCGWPSEQAGSSGNVDTWHMWHTWCYDIEWYWYSYEFIWCFTMPHRFHMSGCQIFQSTAGRQNLKPLMLRSWTRQAGARFRQRIWEGLGKVRKCWSQDPGSPTSPTGHEAKLHPWRSNDSKIFKEHHEISHGRFSHELDIPR